MAGTWEPVASPGGSRAGSGDMEVSEGDLAAAGGMAVPVGDPAGVEVSEGELAAAGGMEVPGGGGPWAPGPIFRCDWREAAGAGASRPSMNLWNRSMAIPCWLTGTSGPPRRAHQRVRHR